MTVKRVYMYFKEYINPKTENDSETKFLFKKSIFKEGYRLDDLLEIRPCSKRNSDKVTLKGLCL